MFRKKVSIIGGGYGGCITALFLSQIKVNNEPLYEITIFDKRESLLDGASRAIARLHMGGEYPLDEQTALDCVRGAFLFNQTFPNFIYSSKKGLNYLLALETEQAGTLSASLIFEHYKKNIQLYKEYCSKIKTDSLSLEEPDKFFKKIPDNTLPDGIISGIATKELGINPLYLNALIEFMLRNKDNINIVTSSKVREVEKTARGFNLVLQDGSLFFSNVVINASWENLFSINQSITIKKQKSPTVYLRALGIADISKCQNKGNPTFCLIGESGFMYSPVNQKVAILYAPSSKASHLDSVVLSEQESVIPTNWENLDFYDAENRKNQMYTQIVKIFPHLQKMKIEHLSIRPTLSFNKTQEERHHIPTKELAPNYFSICPTKATFSVWAALELVEILHPTMVERADGDLISVPKIFSFQTKRLTPELQNYIENYTKKHSILKGFL